jgi:hypothetical protein
MNSPKLEGGLQSILGSFGHFLFTNIDLSKVSDCKQYLLQFENIPLKIISFQSQFVTQQSLKFVRPKNQE